MSDTDTPPSEKTGKADIRRSFQDFEQIHLVAYMQLADAKASVFLAIASGAVAYIAGHYGLDWLQNEPFLGHSLLLSLTTLVLVVSAALGIAVIVPRKSQKRDGIIFYHDIMQIASSERYADLLLEMSETEIFRKQIAYCYVLAKICDQKYRLLNYSFILGVVGYAMFLAVLSLR